MNQEKFKQFIQFVRDNPVEYIKSLPSMDKKTIMKIIMKIII